MTWEKPDPFGAALGTASGFISAAAQAKKDKADADRQAALDRQAAINAGVKNTLEGAQTGEALARTTGLANTAAIAAADAARRARQGGDALWAKGGLSPLTMPTAKPGQHISSHDQAVQWQTRGTLLTNQGDTEDAKIAFERADKLLAQAKVEDDHALAVKTQAETALQHLAERKHWSAQDLQHAKDEVGRMIRAAQDNGTKLEVAAMNGVNAMDRTIVTQAGENTRAGKRLAQERTLHVNTEDNLNRRFNVGIGARAKAASLKSGGNSQKFRNLDPATKMRMGQQMTEALDAHAPPATVYAHAAQMHGITPDEAQGIAEDYRMASE
jgi:tetratricopeptide (TPR) repeat protein